MTTTLLCVTYLYTNQYNIRYYVRFELQSTKPGNNVWYRSLNTLCIAAIIGIIILYARISCRGAYVFTSLRRSCPLYAFVPFTAVTVQPSIPPCAYTRFSVPHYVFFDFHRTAARSVHPQYNIGGIYRRISRYILKCVFNVISVVT